MSFCGIRFQFSFFAPAADITPAPKHLVKLLNALGEKVYLSSAIGELSPGAGVANRLRLASENGDFAINFGGARIDFERTVPIAGRNALQDFANFLVDAQGDLVRIVGAFPRKANRLSMIGEFLCDEMPTDKLLQSHAKFIVPIDFFAATTPFEWNHRVAGSDQVEVAGKMEPLNVILTAFRGSGELMTPEKQAKSFDRVLFTIDVNTKPANIDHRFEANCLDSFFEHGLDVASKICEQVEQRLQ